MQIQSLGLAPQALAFLGFPQKNLLKTPATLEYVRERTGGGRPSSVDIATKAEAVLMRKKKIGYLEIQNHVKQKTGVELSPTTIEKWKRNDRVKKALKIFKETNEIPTSIPIAKKAYCPLDIKVEAVTMIHSGASLKTAQTFVKNQTGTDYSVQTIAGWKNAKKVKEELNKLTKH